MNTWQAIGVTTTIISALIAIATAYLRLFVKNELNELRNDLMTAINNQFVPREIFETRIGGLEQRLARVENPRTITQ